MALIDKETIRAEIERRKIPFKKDIEDGVYPTYLCALMDFEDFLDTLPEQPVEGLDKEIERYCGPYNKRPVPDFIETIARHFAEWQKVQDQKTIELAEDHAMLAGMNKMEQQMMEKAVECVVENWNHEPHPEITIPLNPEVFGVGDKVRVIVIKED